MRRKSRRSAITIDILQTFIAMNFFGWLIPYRAENFRTTLSIEALEQAIERQTTIVPALFFNRGNNYFRGVHITDGYKLIREIRYQNSWLPMTSVVFRDIGTEREVELRSWIPLFISVFTLALIVGFAFAFSFEKNLVAGRFVPLILYIVATGIFQVEAGIAWRKLTGMLQLEKK